MAILAYGEVSIIDITDVGKIQAYITSNQPTVVIYDPNNTASNYNPDWSKNKLTLTPVILFNSTQLNPTDTGVQIEWKRQAGSGTPTTLITGEAVTDGVLNVTANVLSAIGSGLITYICSITYTDPDTQVTVETQAQMSFSLVRNASELKDCTIVGEQTFLYNGEGALTSASTITLTANLANTSISQWQYKNSSGTFVKYPNSGTANTLTVRATDSVFVNDVAIIKLTTTDSSVFDLHQIIKVRDGAAGSNTITCTLSNESQTVPCDSDGNLYPTSLNGCDTMITIYDGADDDTANWSIATSPSAGVTGEYDADTHTFTVTGITVDAGYVEFVATRTSYATITKRFSISKERSGADGEDAVIYSVKPDVPVMKLNESNVFIPTSVTFSGHLRVGNSEVLSDYTGRFKIYESTNGTAFTQKYASSVDESSKAYTPSAETVKVIKCELYSAGSFTTLLDTQTVSVVADGKTGQPGAAGKDAINIVLGNMAEVIACNINGTAKNAKEISIPYSCYKGTARTSGTASLGTLPTGVTLKSNRDATASTEGLIVLTVASGASLFSASSGDITITVTSNNLTSTHKFTITKNIQASNAVLLQIFAPRGDVIVNDSGSVVLNTILMDGSNQVTSGITYSWAQLRDNGSYSTLSNQTGSTLTVTPAMVDSMASFKCTAAYGGKTYSAYWCVTDKSDPVVVTVHCSIGDKLVNNQGVGALYAIAVRNGEELDPIKSTYFSETPPASAASGDYYYKIDKNLKVVTLMKYNGSAWNAAPTSDDPTGTYVWHLRDAKGEPFGEELRGKVIYLDNALVVGKTTFRCKFTM